MEKTGKVYMVAVDNRKPDCSNHDDDKIELRCIVEMKGGNCDDPFSCFIFTGGMVEQARALNPGDTVTITGEKMKKFSFRYMGLSIIGDHTIV